MAKAPDPLAGLDPASTLTIKEAAKALGVSERLIRKEIKEGHLPAVIPGKGVGAGKQGGRLAYRIKPADLRSWFFGE